MLRRDISFSYFGDGRKSRPYSDDSGWKSVVKNLDDFVEFMSAFPDDECRPLKNGRAALNNIGEVTLREELKRRDIYPKGFVDYHLSILKHEWIHFAGVVVCVQGAQRAIDPHAF